MPSSARWRSRPSPRRSECRLGVLTAVFITEMRGGPIAQRVRQAVRVVVTAMSGVPSILVGVFIYAVWV